MRGGGGGVFFPGFPKKNLAISRFLQSSNLRRPYELPCSTNGLATAWQLDQMEFILQLVYAEVKIPEQSSESNHCPFSLRKSDAVATLSKLKKKRKSDGTNSNAPIAVQIEN